MVRRQFPPGLPPPVARRLRQQRRGLRSLPVAAPRLARSTSQRRHRLRPQRQCRSRPRELPGRSDAAPRFLRCRPRPGRPGPGPGRFRRRLPAAPPPHRTRRAWARTVLQRRTDLPEARPDPGRGYVLPAGAERGPAVRRSPAQSRTRHDVAGPGRRCPQLLAPGHPREARTGTDLLRAADGVGLAFGTERWACGLRLDAEARSRRRRRPSGKSGSERAESAEVLGLRGEAHWTERAESTAASERTTSERFLPLRSIQPRGRQAPLPPLPPRSQVLTFLVVSALSSASPRLRVKHTACLVPASPA